MKEYNNFFIDFVKTDFKCPSCQKEYDDVDDKYLGRCSKNKTWQTRVNCSCGEFFYLAIDFRGVPFTYKK
jgi:hypothetical protein